MITQDYQFEIINEDGKNINCIIVASIPINETEINIMYKREDDADDTFRYGKIIKINDSYTIKKALTEEELLALKETFDNEILYTVNTIAAQLEEK